MPRVRIRHVAVCVAIVVWIYYFLPGSQHVPFGDHDATVRLARYMNDVSHLPPIHAKASSFDWSSVNFTYPLSRKPSLPAPFRNRPRIQHPVRAESQEARRLEVKRVFKKSWTSYRSNAWMKDALKPISGGYVDQFSGWAATLVDSLDTLWMMGMRDEFYEAVSAVAMIDFGASTSPRVNTFETCIR
jgi:mannosyl-oligosaccharide alpha-1,2-mannosidase